MCENLRGASWTMNYSNKESNWIEIEEVQITLKTVLDVQNFFHIESYLLYEEYPDYPFWVNLYQAYLSSV